MLNEIIGEKWDRRFTLIAAFLIPLLIGIIVCVDHGVYPFGDRSILSVDMYHQYAPFFAEFMQNLKTGDSLLYSFEIGLGADFVSLYAYYLASPLNWLLLMCPDGLVIEFMTILTLLKFALCGLTFAYYLRCHFKTNDFVVCVFATAYALSGYMAAYSWNIMWTDCMVLLPLIILGVERLVSEGKCSLYYVTLAVSIFSNYYISIMICIFLVLYFGILWLECREGKLKAILNFGWYSLLAGGTGAVLIIPEAIILSASGSGTNTFPEKMEWYFNILAELSRHLLMTERYTTGKDHWPNLYCGVFVLLFFVLYLLNRGISWQKKWKRLVLVALFVLSFANNVLDFIWHGFHFPESLPGRQAFIYMFLLLVICFEVYLHRRETKVWQVLIALLVDFVFLFFSFKAYSVSELATKEEFVGASAEGFSFLGKGFSQFDISAIFLVCYAMIFVLFLIGNMKVKQIAQLMLCLFVITEITVHFDMEGLATTSRPTYMKSYEDYKKLIEVAEEREIQRSENGEVFYRIEQMERRTKNDTAFYGFSGGTQFSSLMNLDVSHIYQYMGLEGGKNFYCYNGATPLFSAMLSMKYVLADNPWEVSPLRTLVASSGEVYLYENHYALPLGYVIPKELVRAWDYKGNGDVQNVNGLASRLGAKEQLLIPMESVDEEGVSTITVQEDGYLFASYKKTSIDNLTAKISNGRSKNFSKVSHNYLLDLGYVRAGETVKITNSDNMVLDTQAYYLNMDALNTAYDNISAQTMQLTKQDTTEIEGVIEVTEAGYLVFSIAKEDGWTLYVDEKDTEAEKFAEAFIATYLDEGTHTIRLCYETPGFMLGGVISVFCIVLFVGTEGLKRWLFSRRKENAYTEYVDAEWMQSRR